MGTNDNREALVSFFESGIKESERFLGVEIEHFIVTAEGKPVTYEPQGELFGVKDVLAYLLDFYTEEIRNHEGDLIGCSNEEGSITLEPASQIEISIAPYEHVDQVVQAYQHFRNLVDPFLQQRGARLVSLGYHPTRKAEDLTLIPKERYRLMNKHFADLGTIGMQMMRASASTQVSVDYTSEADAVRKMRVASALAPVLGAIADNIEAYQGKQVATPLVRLNVWRNVDNARCGVVPGVFDAGFGFGAYADWLLATSPIFINAKQADGTRVEQAEPARSAAEIYANTAMDKEDVEHLISMFWPDVRLKRFVEIRPADSLPEKQLPGYAALIKGLFYSKESLAAIEKALGVSRDASGQDVWPLTASAVEEAIEAIRTQGYAAKLYGEKTLLEWENMLFELAASALDEHEAGYLEPLKNFASNKKWELA